MMLTNLSLDSVRQSVGEIIIFKLNEALAAGRPQHVCIVRTPYMYLHLANLVPVSRIRSSVIISFCTWLNILPQMGKGEEEKP